MINKNTSGRSYASQTAQYTWVAAAFFIVTLILGAFAGIPRVEAGSDSIQRGIDADAARYQAMGEFYLAKVQSDIQRGIDADAARYQAMGKFYLAKADDDLLAANPELMIARRWQAQSFNSLGSCSPADGATLAANPELMLVQGARGC